MNNCQKVIADLIRLSTTKNFPGNQIVDDLEANPDLWHNYYATLHNCTFPGTFSVYDPEGYNVAAENLQQIGIGQMEYNKLCVYSTGKNNSLLEEIMEKCGSKMYDVKSGLIRKEDKYIQILFFYWY